MWPPVPPAATTILIRVAPSGRLARDGKKDTHGREADDEGRPAVAHERERHAGQRQEVDHDADVDEGLVREPGGDPEGDEATERVGCVHRDTEAAPREQGEQEDDAQAADEAELLADDREDEVVPRVRDGEAAGMRVALTEADPEDAAEPERHDPAHGL